MIYVRVSTKEQVDEGNSLSTQEKICRDYCSSARNDYEIVEIFREQGESAKTVDRTELQKLLKYCADKKNGIKAVIIYKLDRLSRNTDDYSQLRLLLKRYGVEIKSTSEHFENTPVGRFMENTMANISQFDNDIRAERCAGGMRDAMRDGRYVWMATVGYKNVQVAGRATIAQDEIMAPLILKTFQLVALNTYPTEEVRRMMTKEGLLNKKGKPFTKGYFYKMLTNELFAGWIVKFGEKHKGHFEPIISEDLFNQVQRILKSRGRKCSAYLTDNPAFPLRKFVKNDAGKVLTGSWSSGRYKKYPFYRFGNDKSSHSRDPFETDFKAYMDKYKLDEKHYQKLKILVRDNLTKATLGQKKEAEQLQKIIKELNEKQSALIKKNLDGVINDTVLKQQLGMIENQLTEVTASLANIPNSDADYDKMIEFMEVYLKQPSSIWSKAKIGVQIKLQWFQFPLGMVFKNMTFGTTEVASVFKTKEAFLPLQSSTVGKEGLEPSPLTGPVPKTGAATNYATCPLFFLQPFFSLISIAHFLYKFH